MLEESPVVKIDPYEKSIAWCLMRKAEEYLLLAEECMDACRKLEPDESPYIVGRVQEEAANCARVLHKTLAREGEPEDWLKERKSMIPYWYLKRMEEEKKGHAQ